MVNRMRATRAHRDNRRSHHALEEVRVSKDTKTGVTHLRHHLCMETGMYRGRKVIDMTATALPVKASSKPAKK
ncbi:50S ribosomal protein L32 [bacterium]|nr:50S ribosomal protein L32 [bacterium]